MEPAMLLEHRYRSLRRLLAANSELLAMLADLESDLGFLEPSDPEVRCGVLGVLDAALLQAQALNLLTGDSHQALYRVHAEIEEEVRATLQEKAGAGERPLVVPLSRARADRVAEVGGKAANLGELRAAMPAVVPDGFVVTTAAYHLFLTEGGLVEPIRRLARELGSLTGRAVFRERTAAIRSLVEASPLPAPLERAIEAAVTGSGIAAPRGWAVRSSGVGEDGRLSFAGQFDTELHVAADGIFAAYRRVVASRWNDRAVLYRLNAGFAEVETPMAVLVVPMLPARLAGVLYTRDPRDREADTMLLSATAGLADDLVRGHGAGATWVLDRSDGAKRACLEDDPAVELPPEDAAALAGLGLAVESHFGAPQDIEWVIPPEGPPHAVQARGLWVEQRRSHGAQPAAARDALVAGGITVNPGRAVGEVFRALGEDGAFEAPAGSILVVRQATPELAAVAPSLGALLAEAGNPAGHAAAVLRDFGVPAVFGMAGALDGLEPGRTVSVDAGVRAVWAGELWPGARERTAARLARRVERRRGGLLHDRLLALHLTDPLASSFRASRCRSVHDIVRFCHETGVAAMFAVGDRVARQAGGALVELATDVPLNLAILDLGGSVRGEAAAVAPEEVASRPFRALWRGISHPDVTWTGRRSVSVAGFASVVARAMVESPQATLGRRNYAVVAPDYLNLNARLAYHFAMVDALLTPSAENNFVNFRFRGGGAGAERRDLRALFLGEVLLRRGFAVDRRGDLVTAWMRRYPADECEGALETLGSLMACARQLDMVLATEAQAREHVERFLAGDYRSFG